MSEETHVNVIAGAQATTKKLRRGVSNSTQAVSQLKFHEKDAAQNGLFVAHLEEVRVDWSTNAESKTFTGKAVPRLTFHFASNHQVATEKRHAYQTLFPVESNVDTIPGGKEEWKVNNVFNWIKHILDVYYLKGRELTEAEEAALTLPFEDFDDEGLYVAIDEDEVLAGYAAIFKAAADMMNGSFGELAEGEVAKPVFKSADGKFITCWIKLLRHRKRKNEWINVSSNGDLGFDTFIGNGAVELAKGQNPPAVLRLDLSKESITPKETKKAPTIGVPGMPGAAMGGVVTADGMSMGTQMNDAFAAAGEQMPF